MDWNELNPQLQSLLESIVSTRKQQGRKKAKDGRSDLVQQRAVGDLFPDAEHDSRGHSGEHGGAGVPEQRAVRPHGPESRTEVAS